MMIGLAGFGDCPALRLVRGGHVWPSLCKYLGHLFVVRKASSDQHATAPVTSARGSGNRADTYWATFRCDTPKSAATFCVREFGSDSVAARSLAFADLAKGGSVLRLRNPHARTSVGLTHIVWLGLACRSSFDVHREWTPYTAAYAPRVNRRGANAQGVCPQAPPVPGYGDSRTSIAQRPKPGVKQHGGRKRHEIPVSFAERYYLFLAASCKLPGENLGNMDNFRVFRGAAPIPGEQAPVPRILRL